MSSGTRGRKGLAMAMNRGGTERPPEGRCDKYGGAADRCICASCNRVRAANRRQDTKWEARDGVCRLATQYCAGLKGYRLPRGACHRRIASWGAMLFVLCSICLPRCASPVSHDERDWSEPALHSQFFFLWPPSPSQDVAIVCMRWKHDFSCPLVTA